MRTPIPWRPDPRRREPLWTRVERNRFRLVAYLGFFALVSSAVLGVLVATLGVVLWYQVGGHAAAAWLFANGWLRPWAIGVAASLLYEWWALSRSEAWVLKRLHAEFVDKGVMIDTKMALKDMRIAAGLPVSPAMYSITTDSVNAFVFKSPGRRPVLGVTTGLVEKLSIDQQRAVFANLVVRVATGDTMVSSAVASLMAPLQWYRAHRMARLDEEDAIFRSAEFVPTRESDIANQAEMQQLISGSFALAILTLPFVFPALFLGEVVAAVQRRSQLTAAEKADAEGMLLLKDPQPMLHALERCVAADNVVSTAGEALGDLFYCWTGEAPDDESDPEWTRVARLREVLGVEGMVPEDLPGQPDGGAEPFAPLPPRLEGGERA